VARLLALLTAVALATACRSPQQGAEGLGPEGNGYAIYGAIERPGVHSLGAGDVTVLEAVQAARPIPGQADLTRVMVMRDAADDSFAVTIDLVPMLESGDTTANLRLRHGDIVVVPPRDG
jgi:protein involved in polysaccharide export with SLBB domain